MDRTNIYYWKCDRAAALPANVFSIWMNFSGSILANYWSRRPVKEIE